MERRLCINRGVVVVCGGVDGGDGEPGIEEGGGGNAAVVMVGECGVGGSMTS